MCTNHKEIDFGSTLKRLAVSPCICIINIYKEEQITSLLRFLLSGINASKESACLCGKSRKETVQAYVTEQSTPYGKGWATNPFILESEEYLKGL